MSDQITNPAKNYVVYSQDPDIEPFPVESIFQVKEDPVMIDMTEASEWAQIIAQKTLDTIRHQIVVEKRPKLLELIIKDPEAIFNYLKFIEQPLYRQGIPQKHPWEEGRLELAKSPRWGNEYQSWIRYQVSGNAERWPELEATLLKSDNPQQIINYTSYTEIERWPEAEPIIIKDPSQIVTYSRCSIKGRWREAEPHLAEDRRQFVRYATCHVVKERLYEWEHILGTVYDYFVRWLFCPGCKKQCSSKSGLTLHMQACGKAQPYRYDVTDRRY